MVRHTLRHKGALLTVLEDVGGNREVRKYSDVKMPQWQHGHTKVNVKQTFI